MSRSNQLAGLITATPTSTLDTINEINTSLNNDSDLSGTLTGLINGKASKSGDTFTGNVGIGTTPSEKLEVLGNFELDGNQYIKSTGRLYFDNGNACHIRGSVAGTNCDLIFNLGSSNPGSEKMRIKANGNVAYTGTIQVDDIVEKTSAHGVEIDGVFLKDSTIEGIANLDGSVGAHIGNSHATGYGVKIRGASDSTRYALTVNNNADNPLMRVLGNGNVGIGTDAPERFLHTKGAGEVQALFENPSTSNSQFAYVDIESNASANGEAILRLKTPDGTSYINSRGSATTMTFSNGNVGIGTGNLTIGNYSSSGKALTFEGSQNTTHYIRFNDNNSTEGTYIKSVGQSDGGTIYMGSRWNTDTDRFIFDTVNGHITPGADNTQNLGSSSKRWANIYTGDLHLSNEGSVNDVDGTFGDWTIQEGSEDLFLINNKSGKKYKLKMEEV